MAHGLRKIRASSQAAQYHDGDLADYYVDKDGKTPSFWVGKGAERLGLRSVRGVTKADYLAVLARTNPATGALLTSRALSAKAVRAFEFVFAAPKSASVVAVFDSRVAAAQSAAVKKVLARIEQDAAVTVQDATHAGRAGLRRTGELTTAVFGHNYSRGNDPHLHSHLHIANFSFDPKSGKYFALQAEAIFKAQSETYSKLYSAELAHELRKLGYEFTADSTSFSWAIEGVSPQLCARLSSSSQRFRGNREVTPKAVDRYLAAALKEKGFEVKRHNGPDGDYVYSVAGVKNALSSDNAANLPKELGEVIATSRAEVVAKLTLGSDARLAQRAEEIRRAQVVNLAQRALLGGGLAIEAAELARLLVAPDAPTQAEVRAALVEANAAVKYTVADLSPRERAIIKQAAANTAKPAKVKLTDEEILQLATAKAETAGLSADFAAVRELAAQAQRLAPVAQPQSQFGEDARRERAIESAQEELDAVNEAADFGVKASPSIEAQLGDVALEPSIDAIYGAAFEADMRDAQAEANARLAAEYALAADSLQKTEEDALRRRLENIEPVVADRPADRLESGLKWDLATAVDFAIAVCFERNTVVKRKALAEHLLATTSGQFSPGDVELAIAEHAELVVVEDAEQKRDVAVTTVAAVAEEAEILALLARAKGTVLPMELTPETQNSPEVEKLSGEQLAAVSGICGNGDAVTILRGLPGTGKTTTLKALDKALRANRLNLRAFATTAAASRIAMREKGFSAATTVAKLLQDNALQDLGPRDVLVVDEVGMMGMGTLHELLKLREERNFRMLLIGDTNQLTPVERGDALRHIEQRGGVKTFTLTEIFRQKPARLNKTITHLAKGETEVGFAQLLDDGCVEENADMDALRDKAAARYVDAITSSPPDEPTEDGLKSLVVAFTNAESDEHMTPRIRKLLRERGQLSEEDVVQFRRLDDRYWTTAQKQDRTLYRARQIVRFALPADNWKAGSTWRVVRQSADEGVVVAPANDPRTNGEVPTRRLDLTCARQFSVFGSTSIEIAEGDLVRCKGVQKTTAGKLLENGTRYAVKKIKDGVVTLDSGDRVDATQFGFLTHDYVRTVYASQSLEARTVLFVVSSNDAKALASRESLNVGASRASHSLTIYTDDCASLRDEATKTSHRATATEVIQRVSVVNAQKTRAQENAARVLREVETEFVQAPTR